MSRWLLIGLAAATVSSAPALGDAPRQKRTVTALHPAARSPSASSTKASHRPARHHRKKKHHRSVHSVALEPGPVRLGPTVAADPSTVAAMGVPGAPLPPAPPRLVIPVAGVLPEQLVDTYLASRSEGRIHDAIDIPAPRNTPVVAAIDGRVIKLFLSERGGITVNELGDDGETVYYYAHLDHYAEGIVDGGRVQQGQVIAYVGDTGNAGAGNCHLHFAIWRVRNIARYWEGDSINPYPLLRGR